MPVWKLIVLALLFVGVIICYGTSLMKSTSKADVVLLRICAFVFALEGAGLAQTLSS